jgi:hypothetical protein
MDSDIKFGPFRPINDFIATATDYRIPDFSDLDRINNRITNNLLYYQTNYLLVVLIFCVIVG